MLCRVVLNLLRAVQTVSSAEASAVTSSLAKNCLQLTFPIMPTQPASVFTSGVEEATGEWRKERVRKKTNTVQEYSGALSIAGSFNSLSVLSLFNDC